MGNMSGVSPGKEALNKLTAALSASSDIGFHPLGKSRLSALQGNGSQE